MAACSARTSPSTTLLFFGSSGDVAHLDRLLERAGLTSEIVAERTIHARCEDATYFVRRLTAAQA